MPSARVLRINPRIFTPSATDGCEPADSTFSDIMILPAEARRPSLSDHHPADEIADSPYRPDNSRTGPTPASDDTTTGTVNLQSVGRTKTAH